MALGQAVVVLTRAPEDNLALRHRLEEAGVTVLELPTAQFADVPLEADAVENLLRADALTFASAHAVSAFSRQVSGDRIRAIAGRIAAVGQTTAAALAGLGLHATVVADAPSTGRALAERLIAQLPPDSAVTVVQARQSQPDLVAMLRAAGHRVDVAVVYQNAEPAAPSPDQLALAARANAIYLAAPSAADRLLAWAPALKAQPLVAIGPTTAQTLRDKHGVQPAAVSPSPELADVAATLLSLCA